MSGKTLSVRPLLNSMWGSIWPARCPVCNDILSPDEKDFCVHCKETFEVIKKPFCNICGLPFDENTAPPSSICGNCLKAPLKIDILRSFGNYEGALRKAIIDLKFGCRREMVPALVNCILNADQTFPDHMNIDMVIPVPLHPKRTRERGFNQAIDLARPLARKRKTPLLYDSLIRTRPTAPQVGLSTYQRKANVKGAFSVRKSGPLKNKNIFLVDDIYTTGNTINECAKVLKKAGVEKVYAVTAARAV
jgi:ComF family protein